MGRLGSHGGLQNGVSGNGKQLLGLSRLLSPKLVTRCLRRRTGRYGLGGVSVRSDQVLLPSSPGQVEPARRPSDARQRLSSAAANRHPEACALGGTGTDAKKRADDLCVLPAVASRLCFMALPHVATRVTQTPFRSRVGRCRPLSRARRGWCGLWGLVVTLSLSCRSVEAATERVGEWVALSQ